MFKTSLVFLELNFKVFNPNIILSTDLNIFHILFELDLPVLSPLSHEVLRTLNRWQDIALNIITTKGPPTEDYIPGNYIRILNYFLIIKYKLFSRMFYEQWGSRSLYS